MDPYVVLFGMAPDFTLSHGSPDEAATDER